MINTYINRKLKEFGDEYFLTEFDIVNPTSAPVTYDLFNSNTLNLIPTTQSLPTVPSTLNTLYNLSSSVGLAINTTNNTLYASVDTNLVRVFDLNTNTLITTLTFPVDANGLVYNSIDNTVYVIANTGGISVIDCNTNTITVNITLAFGVNINVNAIAFNPADNAIHIVTIDLFTNYYISKIDCVTNTLVGDALISDEPDYITYCPTNNSIYAPAAANSVFVVDCSTNTLTTTISVSTNPVQSAYNTLSNKMYVTCKSGFLDIIDCATNTVVDSVDMSFTTARTLITYNSLLNIMTVTTFNNNQIINVDCATNTVSPNPSSPYILPSLIVYNASNNSNVLYGFDGNDVLIVQTSTQASSYILGSYNYNQFLQDIKNNPCLVRIAMLYSENPNNLNQVFFDTVRDANGEITYRPQTPSLQVSANQFQASVAKVQYGKKGFVLNQESSWSNFVVQPLSSVRVILLQKQFNLISMLSNKDSNCVKLENNLLFRTATTVSQKLKLIRDDFRALPINVTDKPKTETKNKKPKQKPKESKCEEVWKEHYGVDGGESAPKSEIFGMSTNTAIGVGVALLASVGFVAYNLLKK